MAKHDLKGSQFFYHGNNGKPTPIPYSLFKELKKNSNRLKSVYLSFNLEGDLIATSLSLDDADGPDCVVVINCIMEKSWIKKLKTTNVNILNLLVSGEEEIANLVVLGGAYPISDGLKVLCNLNNISKE